MPLLRRKPRVFTLQVQDIVLRITAPQDYYEECRAAALSMWEQVSSYSIRNPAFRTSKRPVIVPGDAPQVIRDMAGAGRVAGVGPVFTLQGALTDHIGRYLARSLPEVLVSAGGDHHIRSRKRMKLLVHRTGRGDEGLFVIVDPARGAQGIATTLGRRDLPPNGVDGLAVLAQSCALADAAAAATIAIVSRPDSFRRALDYLQGLPGVHGALLVQGDRIGVAGGVEVAA